MHALAYVCAYVGYCTWYGKDDGASHNLQKKGYLEFVIVVISYP